MLLQLPSRAVVESASPGWKSRRRASSSCLTVPFCAWKAPSLPGSWNSRSIGLPAITSSKLSWQSSHTSFEAFWTSMAMCVMRWRNGQSPM